MRVLTLSKDGVVTNQTISISDPAWKALDAFAMVQSTPEVVPDVPAVLDKNGKVITPAVPGTPTGNYTGTFVNKKGQPQAINVIACAIADKANDVATRDDVQAIIQNATPNDAVVKAKADVVTAQAALQAAKAASIKVDGQ